MDYEQNNTVRGLMDAIGLTKERGSALVHLRLEHAEAILNLIKRTDKELEFEKAFNGNLCEAISQKRKRCDEVVHPQAGYGTWIPCGERLPKAGENVILYFRDTFHTDPSWPETQVLPAWRCNVAEENKPNGQWAIEGRIWSTTVIDIEDGIAWMPLPKAVKPDAADKRE